tara:strand:+ start:4210 stop:4362 length:153 start_codon:yes stop_codon:yes gene_type:complete
MNTKAACGRFFCPLIFPVFAVSVVYSKVFSEKMNSINVGRLTYPMETLDY